jgi:hypothetical protein
VMMVDLLMFGVISWCMREATKARNWHQRLCSQMACTVTFDAWNVVANQESRAVMV